MAWTIEFNWFLMKAELVKGSLRINIWQHCIDKGLDAKILAWKATDVQVEGDDQEESSSEEEADEEQSFAPKPSTGEAPQPKPANATEPTPVPCFDIVATQDQEPKPVVPGAPVTPGLPSFLPEPEVIPIENSPSPM